MTRHNLARFSIGLLLLSFPLLADPSQIFKANKDRVLLIRSFVGERTTGVGSSFVAAYGGKNYLISNYHVIQNGAFYVDMGGKRVEAQVLRASDTEDVAVMTFAGIEKLRGLPLASNEPAEGDAVFAIGYPVVTDLNNPSLTIVDGLVSNAKLMVRRSDETEKRYVQISAGINPGNSGGPVLGKDGSIIGMATLKWLNLASVGAAIPAADIIKEIKAIRTRPPTEKEAQEALKKRCDSIAQMVRGKMLMDFGSIYAPSVKAKAYPEALRAAGRIIRAATKARELHPEDAVASRKELLSILDDQDAIFFAVLDNHLRSIPEATVVSVLSDTNLATRMYLSSRFFYHYIRLAKVPLQDLQLDRYEIQKITFADNMTTAVVEATVFLKEKSFPVKLRFANEWDVWFLLPSYD